jgi:hypothetical protein
MVTDSYKITRKMPRPKPNPNTRTLYELKEEFITRAGDFENFHNTMNGREKLLFKGWLQSMRLKRTSNFTA